MQADRQTLDGTFKKIPDVRPTRTNEPKLQVPLTSAAGQPPRRVLLERERRFYADQDLEELLVKSNISFKTPTGRCALDIAAAVPPLQVNIATAGRVPLPLPPPPWVPARVRGHARAQAC